MKNVRGRFRCNDADLFIGSVASVIKSDNGESVTVYGEMGRLINHFIIEFIASIVFMLSAVYVPEEGSDFMKQYVSSLSILAVMLTVKDKLYFCPDGTPMATIVLAMSGAYTNEQKKTDWVDIVVRVSAQLVGWVVVCFGVIGMNKGLFVNGLSAFTYTTHTSNAPIGIDKPFIVLNEFIATFIECVAISFMVMPLLKAYVSVVGSEGGFKSKEEAMPPKNKDLWFAAISLSILHYVLERLFRATMNPLVYVMNGYLKNFDDAGHVGAVVAVQITALGFACLYCYYLLPSSRVFDHVR